MKTLLGGKGEVAILTGSLTAVNATQRIAGFQKALEGSGIKVVQTLNDDADPAKALSNAQTALQGNPDLTGMYTVWSYDGPRPAGGAGRGQDREGPGRGRRRRTQDRAVRQGRVVQAMILQRPYQQGYLGIYLLTAMKVPASTRPPRSSSRTCPQRTVSPRSAPASAWSQGQPRQVPVRPAQARRTGAMTAGTVSITGVRKSYGPVRVLDVPDLTLRAGQVVALVGENGAGKSTLTGILSAS